MNENLNKVKRLIKEGEMKTQDKFIEIMMEIRKKNPELSHDEIIGLMQSEFDRFLKFHKNDRSTFPSVNKNIKVIKDRMPIMKIPYGDKRKGV